MPNKKSDLTKRAIENQFIELLKTKNICDIKVTDITEPLELHRTTFYKYYDSIYDVAEAIEERLILHTPDSTPGNTAKKNFQHIFNSNSAEQIFIMLDNPDREPAFNARVSRLTESSLIDVIKNMNIHPREEDLPIFCTFTQHGICGLVKWVLSKDCNLSVEESAYIVDQLLIRTLKTINEVVNEGRIKLKD